MATKSPEALARRKIAERLRQRRLREDPEYRKKQSLRKSEWNKKNRARHQEHVVRWNAKHKEFLREYEQQWRLANLDHNKELRSIREPDVAIRRTARLLRKGELELHEAVRAIGEYFTKFNEKVRRSSD